MIDAKAEASFAARPNPRIAAQILKPLRATALEQVWQEIIDLARPSIRFVANSGSSRGASKLGGLPDFGTGSAWPHGVDGAGIAFVAQIDLSDVQRIFPNDLIPETGLLGFFYDDRNKPDGYQLGDRGGWAIRYANHSGGFASPPTGVKSAFHEVPLAPRAELTLPGLSTIEMRSLQLTEPQMDAYEDVLSQLDEAHGPRPAHRFLGWPDEIQRDPAIYIQLTANGLDLLDPDVFRRKESRKLLARRGIWRLVCQIESDESARMLWGDNGALYFMMREPDLRERAWDNAWLNSQSY